MANLSLKFGDVPLTRIYIMKRMHSTRKRQKTGLQHMPLYKQP